jgi:AraC-like DNA-binding protein
MRWYSLLHISFILYIICAPSPALAQTDLSATKEIDQLTNLAVKNQWTDPYATLNYADQALKKSRDIDYKKGIANAETLRGFCYWAFGDNDLAIQSALEVLDIAQAEDLPRLEAESYYLMARGYMDLRENKKAQESIVKAEQLAEEGNDFTQLCSIYNLKGVIYFLAENYDSALYFYNRAYELGKNKSVDPINLPRIISNIGECYETENPALGFRYYNQALALAKETNNKIAEASITSIIGHAFKRAKDFKNAEDHLQVALRLASDLGLRRVMRNAYSGLVDIRLSQGKGDEAVIYLRRFYAVRDSLLNSSKIRQIVELEAKHELQLREKNIQLLESENQIHSIQKNILIGVFFMAVLIFAGIVMLQRYRYRKNHELLNLEIDKYKSRQEPVIDDKIASYDQKLLAQAMSIVEANIADSQLGVEKMAEEMNMSRTSLHRKIKSITGLPPSELIRSIRLRRAARMIANKTDSATQIAHSVGFEDYSHFSKAFKKHFGVSPSAYEG